MVQIFGDLTIKDIGIWQKNWCIKTKTSGSQDEGREVRAMVGCRDAALNKQRLLQLLLGLIAKQKFITR